MNVPRSLNRFVPSWRTLHRVLTICVLVALLTGLIPPPLVRSVAEIALPAPLAVPVADAVEALLPTASVQAASLAAPVAVAPSAPVNASTQRPLAQGVSGGSVLTITKQRCRSVNRPNPGDNADRW